MQKFFFHVRQGNVRFEDTQGALLPDIVAAWNWAVQDARAIANQQALSANPDEQWMEIGDESGAVIGLIPFTRALRPN